MEPQKAVIVTGSPSIQIRADLLDSNPDSNALIRLCRILIPILEKTEF